MEGEMKAIKNSEKAMEGEMKAIKNSENIGSELTQPWHKPKNGSVFPAKRRSVKQMMWERVVDPPMAEMGSKMFSPPLEASKSKKNNSVHPIID